MHKAKGLPINFKDLSFWPLPCAMEMPSEYDVCNSVLGILFYGSNMRLCYDVKGFLIWVDSAASEIYRRAVSIIDVMCDETVEGEEQRLVKICDGLRKKYRGRECRYDLKRFLEHGRCPFFNMSHSNSRKAQQIYPAISFREWAISTRMRAERR